MRLKVIPTPKQPKLHKSTARAIIDLVIKAGITHAVDFDEDDSDELPPNYNYSHLKEAAGELWNQLYYFMSEYDIEENPEEFIPFFQDLLNHKTFMVDLSTFLGLTPDQLESTVEYLERE